MITEMGEYLCQVNDSVSCGACCGLYNVAEPSRDALTAILMQRTRWFDATARTMDDILAFADRVERTESRDRPFSDFHHCPYLGLVGENRSRTGCLLHPLGRGNNGVDWRGLSYYGGMACREYFCPSARNLPVVYKKILKQAVPDWYLYGLIITEEDLIRAFFKQVEDRLGRAILETDTQDTPALNNAIRRFAEIKPRWRFRKHPHDGLCHYFFKDPPIPRPTVDYSAAGGDASGFDGIFRELRSSFSTHDALMQAESEISALVDEVAEALRRTSP